MNHRSLARAFQRILAVSSPVTGSALLLACAPSSDASSTSTQDDGSSGQDGVGQPGVADAQQPVTGDAAESSAPLDAAGQVGQDGQGAPEDATLSDVATGQDSTAIQDAFFGDALGDAPTDAGGTFSDARDQGDAADARDAMYAVTSCGAKVLVSVLQPLQCYAQCLPFDAGAFAAADAGDGGLTRGQCTPFCGTAMNWFSCQVIDDAGVSLMECVPDCTGRRPAGLVGTFDPEGRGEGAHPPSRSHGLLLGEYFAQMARLEAASVDAFRHLRRELVAHRAPRRLIRAAERAARDEVRHARMTHALALRYGANRVVAQVRRQPVRTLEEIAVENAVEGCVREAFGALVAHWQSVAALDRVVRRAMARIASDETRHAALAFQVDAWLGSRLDATARARVQSAKAQAASALVLNAPIPSVVRAELGLPSAAQSRDLAEQFSRLVA